MKLFRKLKKQTEYSQHFTLVGNNEIDNAIIAASDDVDKSLKLDIGAGQDCDGVYTTLDCDSSISPDLVVDIRSIFAPSDYYRERKALYPDIDDIRYGKYKVVRMKHTLEHIEWLYYPSLFEWLSSLLCDNGIIIIDTPNLEYISLMYLGNLDKQRRGEKVGFPAQEHPNLSNSELFDMQRWVNFKLFSGCSPGDYHFGCLDEPSIANFLYNSGFKSILIFNGKSLRVVAYKDTSTGIPALLDLIKKDMKDSQ